MVNRPIPRCFRVISTFFFHVHVGSMQKQRKDKTRQSLFPQTKTLVSQGENIMVKYDVTAVISKVMEKSVVNSTSSNVIVVNSM